MSDLQNIATKPSKKQLAKEKLARIPIKIIPTTNKNRIPKPPWIRVKLPTHNRVAELKNKIKDNHLVTVCEEARALRF